MIDCKKYSDEILDSITGYGHLAIISVGDCVSDRITPVPGGVGLLTRAMLMKHVERRA